MHTHSYTHTHTHTHTSLRICCSHLWPICLCLQPSHHHQHHQPHCYKSVISLRFTLIFVLLVNSIQFSFIFFIFSLYFSNPKWLANVFSWGGPNMSTYCMYNKQGLIRAHVGSHPNKTPKILFWGVTWWQLPELARMVMFFRSLCPIHSCIKIPGRHNLKAKSDFSWRHHVSQPAWIWPTNCFRSQRLIQMSVDVYNHLHPQDYRPMSYSLSSFSLRFSSFMSRQWNNVYLSYL